MKCSSCGKEIRDGATFCTNCGTQIGAAGGKSVTNVPLIMLAPQENTFSKQRMLRYGKMMVAIVLVAALAVGAAFVAAWIKTDPFKKSSFEEVENTKYRDCLALVADVRNDNFDSIVGDVINMEGDMENYNFLSEYEGVFKEVVPDDGSTPEEIKFRNCCFMTAYTEFTAKKYKYLSDKGLFGVFYVDEADKFRTYADELWQMLNDAETSEDLDAIITYCDEKVGIRLKESQ